MEKLRLIQGKGLLRYRGGGSKEGDGGLTKHACLAVGMLGLWFPSPSGHLGSSGAWQTMRGSDRQASPAAAAQAAGTREKFVKEA